MNLLEQVYGGIKVTISNSILENRLKENLIWHKDKFYVTYSNNYFTKINKRSPRL
ncbi:Pectate lyase related protein, secreted [Clostridium acetobutylicum EA 2018]|nr:Pectate lyase related protein, secreted [Clostridium acetobutylicum EA 2018]AEI31319.1 Pectate lyase related protein, secreted [Clostridium acetobutylicum DSM 1731]AWV80277.1 pectate lyase [Clostridium acetobutylicum]PSM06080.1 pectate lyase [Clostridium sp. NJ4]MBC2392462.1 pectate lyase [Clostridium acetobutylicum]